MSVSISGNFNALKDLAKTLNELVKKDVFVGIPEEANKSLEDQPSFNMATLAAVLEFGNNRIRERPFLRQTLQENRTKYVLMFVSLFKKGVEPEKIYEQLAIVAQADVQENMVKGNWLENSDSTKIAWAKEKRKPPKGTKINPNDVNKNPLIWDGNLKGSIKGIVR